MFEMDVPQVIPQSKVISVYQPVHQHTTPRRTRAPLRIMFHFNLTQKKAWSIEILSGVWRA